MAGSPGVSTASPHRDRSWTWAPATGPCWTRSAPWAGRRAAWSVDRPGATSSEAELAEIEGEFAAVVFWHSLEHLRDAGASLDRAAELLAPGGVVVIAMPNPDSLQAQVFGDRWFALDLPRHLVHVPAKTLLTRLSGLGLEPTRVSQLRGGQVLFGWLHGIVGSLSENADLYDAIRRPEARRRPMSSGQRAGTLAAGAVAVPVSVAGTLLEAGLHRGGTIYVEARRG